MRQHVIIMILSQKKAELLHYALIIESWYAYRNYRDSRSRSREDTLVTVT